MGARGRTAEMLSTNLLWQAGIPCFSCKWGCSSTDHDAYGAGGPRQCHSDPQACRYPPVHPTPELSGWPNSAARASPKLSPPAMCPPLPARTFLRICMKSVSSPPVTGQASAQGKQRIGPIPCARTLLPPREIPSQKD